MNVFTLYFKNSQTENRSSIIYLIVHSKYSLGQRCSVCIIKFPSHFYIVFIVQHQRYLITFISAKNRAPYIHSGVSSTILKNSMGSNLPWTKSRRQRDFKRYDWFFRRSGTRKDWFVAENQNPRRVSHDYSTACNHIFFVMLSFYIHLNGCLKLESISIID